ncbi:hypothetical protein OHA37_39420 [Streptomyces sp. NBC_00335]|uniref:hypothetical protein n=1 Tax=unclassified Streptomyces TaxID=2593676 RepID=UPI00225486AD|nr:MULTISPECIES: hypothetical protein [unclassified Streptomyces]MCX5409897.1 hypothetical protein [Streptomyces sp. NBC_00086]
MSEGTWAVVTSRETVLLLAALAVYLGGAVGFARRLPRLLVRHPGWRRDTERDPVSSAVTLTLLIVLWPATAVYLACRIAASRRDR